MSLRIGSLSPELLRFVINWCGQNRRRIDLVCRAWHRALSTSDVWRSYLGKDTMLNVDTTQARQLAECMHVARPRDYTHRLCRKPCFEECRRVVLVMDRSVLVHSPEVEWARKQGRLVRGAWGPEGSVIVRTEHPLQRRVYDKASHTAIGHLLDFACPLQEEHAVLASNTVNVGTLANLVDVVGMTMRMWLVCPRRGICVAKGPGAMDFGENDSLLPPEWGCHVDVEGGCSTTITSRAGISARGDLSFVLHTLGHTVDRGERMVHQGMMLSWAQVSPGSLYLDLTQGEDLRVDNHGVLCDEVLDELQWQAWQKAGVRTFRG